MVKIPPIANLQNVGSNFEKNRTKMTNEVKQYYDELINCDDDYLIQLTTILKFDYNTIYIETAKNILKERKIEVDFNDRDFFVELFIKTNYEGWQNELRNMFSELILNGWELNIPIKSKEKYGNFICNIETNNIKLKSTVEKYKKIINSLCSRCGSQENVFNDQTDYWIENICESCWTNKMKNQHTISEITESGFKYGILINDFKFELKYFEWNQVKNININIPEYGNNFELEINFDSENLYLQAKTDVNFFRLLKYIPKEKLTSTDYDFIDNLFLNLTDCKICGKISVYESSCLVCNENLEEILKNQRNQSWKRYNNIEEIIKKEQENFQYNTKHIITIKYRFQNDISFEKYLDFVDLKTKK